MFRSTTSPVQFGFQPRKHEPTRSNTPGPASPFITAHQKFLLTLNACEIVANPHKENPQLKNSIDKMIELKNYIQSLEVIYGHSIELQKLETQNRPSLAFGEYKALIKVIFNQTKKLFPQDDKKDEKLAFQKLTTSLTDMRNPATKSQINYCQREFQVIYEKLINNPVLADTIQKTVEDINTLCASFPTPQSNTIIPVSFRRGLPGKEFKPRVITPDQTDTGTTTQQNHPHFALSPSPRAF